MQAGRESRLTLTIEHAKRLRARFAAAVALGFAATPLVGVGAAFLPGLLPARTVRA